MKSLKTRKVANYITKLCGLKLDVFQGNTELKSCCKLYHKTTWFETIKYLIIANSVFVSCKLYHKTTWFETKMIEIEAIFTISVANYITKLRGLKQISVIFFLRAKISCKLYHKTTWFETKLPHRCH